MEISRKYPRPGVVSFIEADALLLDGQPVYWRPKTQRRNAIRFRERLTLRERIESCPDISGVEV